MTSTKRIKALEQHSLNIRRNVIQMLTEAGSGHTAGSLGIVEILVSLYGHELMWNRLNPVDPTRDFFILSAGHLCPALYATLAEFGAIDQRELLTLRKFGSRLQGHPERTRLPWLETTSGPLGEGLSQAAGIAYGLEYLLPSNQRRVYCVLGDGECDEGEIWEAAFFASKYKLAKLITVVDCNNIQLSGPTHDVLNLQPFGDKWRDCGWEVYSIANANNMAQVVEVLDRAKLSRSNRPRVVLAYTTPGAGVSFIQNNYHWHGKVPNRLECVQALAELSGGEPDIAGDTTETKP